MYIRVLGPLEVEGDDGRIQIGPPMDRALLCLLALRAGNSVSASRLLEGLWGEDPPASARKGLQGRISALRNVLPEGSITTTTNGYALAIDPTAVDAHQFEQLLLAARPSTSVDDELPVAQDLRRGCEAIESALQLWRGPPLPELSDKVAGLAEIARLEELHLSAQEDRAELRLLLGEHREVLADLEAAVTSEPLRERRWRQLMLALYRSGRQAEALRAYQKLQRLLTDELGLEPGPELRLIERLILEHSSDLDWVAPLAESKLTGAVDRPIDKAGAVDPRVPDQPREASLGLRPAQSGGWASRAVQFNPNRLPFVGREVELGWLTSMACDDRGNSQPSLVVVTGRAGHGKTRLLSELCRVAVNAGALVAGGSAENDGTLPYGPFADAVRDISEQSNDQPLAHLGHLRDDLAWLVPELGPPPRVEIADYGLARTRLTEAVVQLLASAGGSQPLLLMIDDAHQMGESAMSLLRVILGRTWRRNVSVVVACRSDEDNRGTPQGEAVTELLRHEGAVVMELDRLSVTDLSKLIDRLDSSRQEDLLPLNAEWLAEETGGIPLLVREILAGPFAKNQPPESEPSGGHTVGPLVGAVIGRRLSQLPDTVQPLLEIAAVVGIQFGVEEMAVVAGCSADEVTDRLDAPLRAAIITETGQYGRYAFDHGLIREVIESGLPPSRRVRLHGAIAKALSAQGAWLEASRHALAGWSSLSVERGIEIVLSGVDDALTSLDFELALQLCAEALRQAGDIRGEHRIDLMLRLGRAQSLSGLAAQADETWMAAADLARQGGDSDRLSLVALAMVQHARMTSPSQLRWLLLSEALERGGHEWSRMRVQVACAWLIDASTTVRRAATWEFGMEVVAAARGLDDPVVLASAYHARHVLSRSLPVGDRRQYSDELREIAERLGDPCWLFHARLDCFIDTVSAGDGDRAAQELVALRQASAEFRDPFAVWSCERATSTFARLRGQFDTAEEHAAAAINLGTRYGIVDAEAAHVAGQFVNAYHRGGLMSIRPTHERFAAQHPKILPWILSAGVTAASSRDIEAAQTALEHALPDLDNGPQDAMWLPAACLAADIAGWIGVEPGLVRTLEELLQPFAGQFALVGPLSSEYGPTDRCLGMLAANRGDHDCAEEHFQAAVDLSQKVGSKPWELRTQADWVITERAAGRASRDWWGTLEERLTAAGLEGTKARLLGHRA